MFDDLFNNLKGFIDSKIQEVGNDLQKRFGVPEPAEPFVLIRRFTPADSTVTRGCIAIIGESWQIEAYDDNTQILKKKRMLPRFKSVCNLRVVAFFKLKILNCCKPPSSHNHEHLSLKS